MNQSNNITIARQAIIVIHGIGNQRPMGTLRGFVESYLGYRNAHHKEITPDLQDDYITGQYWSALDRQSNSVDLRMLVTEGDDSLPTTHFYEYYWAHKMEDTKIKDVTRWLFGLLTRNPSSSGRRITKLWIYTWIIIIGLVAAFIKLGLLIYGFFVEANGLSLFEYVLYHWTWTLTIPIGLLAFGVLFYNFVISYAGDAARYYRRAPNNIANRQAIISDGVALLRRINDSGRYDRIKIVGHSLGAQIAYDIISIAWAYYNKSLDLTGNDNLLTLLKETNEISDPNIMQTKQTEIWNQYQNNKGLSWKVSDLITLGAPLTHARFLMANKTNDFEYLTKQKELPKLPAVEDSESNQVYYEFGGSTYLHHAAVFLLTRWTNIYYPGDVVGGTLAGGLGDSALNIKVLYNGNAVIKWLSTWSPFTHNAYYFSKRKKTYNLKDSWAYHAIVKLGEALDR
jgi:hypothetical protein